MNRKELFAALKENSGIIREKTALVRQLEELNVETLSNGDLSEYYRRKTEIDEAIQAIFKATERLNQLSELIVEESSEEKSK